MREEVGVFDMSRIPISIVVLSRIVSEQFELDSFCFGRYRAFAFEDLYVSELFISYAENADAAAFGQYGFDSFDMHLCVVHAGAVSYIS